MTLRPEGLPTALASLDRAAVIGVLNVTPDSFSDGGSYFETDAAIARGVAMRDMGADLIDVGGESTRPGAMRVPADVECARVLPVIRELVSAGVNVSVDTMRASTAAAAVAAGACAVNDVSGGLGDPHMYQQVAELGVPYILMHWRGHSARMEELAVYEDVVRDVCAELRARIGAAVTVGVDADRIVIDPGLGFAKTADHNWAILGGLDEVLALGSPVLIGASRKRFLGSLLADGSVARAFADLDAATSAISAIAAAQGVWGVRVHDVRGSGDAVRVAAAWRNARREQRGDLPGV